jgi:predicted nucleotidyltransferase
MQVRLDRAHQVARRAAAFLKSKFSAVRVILFGSVINSDLFHRRSDVDLAVWGINDHDYFRAVGMLQSLDPEFSIDLIIFEEASDSLQMKILNEGTEV